MIKKYHHEWNMFMFWTVSLMRQRTLQQVQCSHYSGHLVSPHTWIQLQIFRQLLLSWPSWRRSTQKGPTVYLFGTIYAWGKLYLSTAVCLAANPEAHQKDTVSGQEQGTVKWYACGKEAAGRVEGRLVSKHSGWGERGETLGV